MSIAARLSLRHTFPPIRVTHLFFLVALLVACSLWYPPSLSVKTLCSSTSHTSGLTGRLFKGHAVRKYTGRRHFARDSTQQARPTGIAALGSITSSKWAVVTTIFKPNQAILATAALQRWAVVVVGDKGAAPFNASAPSMVYLDVAEQQRLRAAFGDFIDLLPWKHFGRKNIGFLYAIAHGAETIWDFDDDNALKPGVEPHIPSSEVYHVQMDNNCSTFNPYPHMGAPIEGVVEPWPRGYPLTLIRKPCKHTLVPGSMSDVAVVQSLADHEPDVDGMFRLTRNIPFNFDPSSKQVLVLPRGILTPYNAQATLTLKPAFWSMLLPVTVHGRVTDIWRSYIAQRLLWDIGKQLAFAPPMVDQYRNPHDPLADMDAENDLYFKSLALVKFLKEWQGTAPTLEGRFEELVIGMYERQYLGEKDVRLVQQWLMALTAAGYKFPQLAPHALRAEHEQYVYRDPSTLPVYAPTLQPNTTAASHATSPCSTNSSSVQASAASAPAVATAKCPTSNVDIFIVASYPNFPLLTLVLRSISIFMPCRGMTHVVVDPPNARTVRAWVDADERKVHIHGMNITAPVKGIWGYILQQWIMFWADELAKQAGSNPDYFMYFDTDSVLALPVTCASLFDERGRLYIPGAPSEAWPNFKRAATEVLGLEYKTNYMVWFPFSFPAAALQGVRDKVTSTINATSNRYNISRPVTDFDEAFAIWSRSVKPYEVSQFVTFGTYAEHYLTDSVHTVHCPKDYDPQRPASECSSYLPLGTHYAGRPCVHLTSCRPGEESSNMYWDTKVSGMHTSPKYTPESIKLIETLIEWGTCYKDYLVARQLHGSNAPLPLGCSREQATTIHPELLPYPRQNVSIELQRKWDQMLTYNASDTLCQVAKATLSKI